MEQANNSFSGILNKNGVTFYALMKEMGLDPTKVQGIWYGKFYGDRFIEPEEREKMILALKKLMPEEKEWENLIKPVKYQII